MNLGLKVLMQVMRTAMHGLKTEGLGESGEAELKWVLTGGPMQLKQIGCRNAAQCSMGLPGCKLRL